MPFVSGVWRPFTWDEFDEILASLKALVDAAVPADEIPNHDYSPEVTVLLGAPDLEWHDVRKIGDRLLIEYLINNAPFKYYSIFAYAADVTRQTYLRSPSASTEWSKAIPMILRIKSYGSEQQEIDNLRYGNQHVLSLADAARRLRERFNVDFCRSGLLEPTERKRILELISAEALARGGPKLFNELMNMLAPCWTDDFNRYIVSLNVNTSPPKSEASTPIGYLYNLAAKAASTGSTSNAPTLSDDDYYQLIKDFCALEAVEPYTWAEVSFQSGTRLIDFLGNLGKLQGAFTLPQVSEADLPDLLNAAFAWVDAPIESLLGWTINDAVEFCRAATASLTDRLGGVCITKAILQPKLSGMAVAIFDRLWDVFSHHPGSVNTNFIDPFDAPNVNVHIKPLIGIATDKSIVGLRSVSACGWYVAIARELFKTGKITDIDERVGLAFEPFIRDRLKRFGTVHHGKYTASSAIGKGEIDAALENTSVIVLFELKKKRLTPAAQTGSTVDLLLDLARGVVHAVAQLNKAELALYIDGQLSLPTGPLLRNCRPVKQVVLSWHEYGVFHDHAFLRNFLEKLTGASLTATNPERTPEVEEVSKQLAEVAKWENQLAVLPCRLEKVRYVSSFFYSAGQLLDMMRSCSTTDDLIRHLTFNERVVNGALDFYFEYNRHRPRLAQPPSAGTGPP